MSASLQPFFKNDGAVKRLAMKKVGRPERPTKMLRRRIPIAHFEKIAKKVDEWLIVAREQADKERKSHSAMGREL